ncbi:hypothetical protein BBK14_11175 [Parafrankia soli]|uniref:Uncharacterized protein n=1 Tax=Parafrankia soli TaxID=2599596 RepID=A0A1S1R8D3_9ACTN|nr:hypothetical protein [Parafrankia soli]OHV42176.1 hypothetical protein BBK14_11175 [Parafrankia soli]
MVLAGDLIRAEDAFTDWESFTASFTNFTLGNGTRAGEWRRVGNETAELIAQFTFGSTSSISAGLGLTLPGGLSGDGSAHRQTVSAFAWDNSASAGYVGRAVLQSGGGTQLDRIYGPSGTQWNATTPFTWAVNDFLLIEGPVKVTT